MQLSLASNHPYRASTINIRHYEIQKELWVQDIQENQETIEVHIFTLKIASFRGHTFCLPKFFFEKK